MKNKKKLLIPLILALFGLFVFGTTYAFFSATITNVNKTNTVLKSQSLTLTFRGTNEVVNCSNIIPGDKCIKEFEVQNTSNTETYFNIYMEDVENGFNSDLVYTLKEGNTEVIAETVAPETLEGKTYIKTGVTIPANTTKSYTLTIEFKHTDSDQNINQGKEFTTTVGIDTTQVEGVVKVINGGTIDASNIADGTSITKTFRVMNIASTNKQYDITLSDVVNTYANGLQYSLSKNGVEVISTTAMPTEDTMILSDQRIDSGATDIYTMTINYDSTQAMFEGYKLLANETNVFTAEVSINTEEVKLKCMRANTATLHTEECTQTDTSKWCSGLGYTESGTKGTTTITYGNSSVTSGTLTPGDAFDCDINGDKQYDPQTERFYYVSTKNNGQTSDDDTAVLVYYNNYVSGTTLWGVSVYYPQDAVANLPTVNDWTNMRLTSTTRDITYGNGKIRSAGFVYQKDGVDLAARLLTIQEVSSACGSSIPSGSGAAKEMDSCVYLLENTKFANSQSLNHKWTWLESANSSTSAWVYGYSAEGCQTTARMDKNQNKANARPAIEVAKSDIDY